MARRTPPTLAEEDALLRRHGLPEDTNRQVLFRVLASLDAVPRPSRAVASPLRSPPKPALPPASPPPPPPVPPQHSPPAPASMSGGRTDRERLAAAQAALGRRTSACRVLEARHSCSAARYGCGIALRQRAALLVLATTAAFRGSLELQTQVALAEKDAQLAALRERLSDAARASTPALSYLHQSGSTPFRTPLPPSSPSAPPPAAAALQAKLVQAASKLEAEVGRRRAADDARSAAERRAERAEAVAAALRREVAVQDEQISLLALWLRQAGVTTGGDDHR